MEKTYINEAIEFLFIVRQNRLLNKKKKIISVLGFETQYNLFNSKDKLFIVRVYNEMFFFLMRSFSNDVCNLKECQSVLIKILKQCLLKK